MRFSVTLISWYHKNKRDLPWRFTKDVYKIWVSEIILQQTRVAQGTQYYIRFLERFPDIQALVMADESEVLKMWQGLGYYSRARNMHAAAKQILNEYGGVFPSDYKSLMKIKGIGSYTASALLSFGYNLPYPVIDGNVKRIISRLFAIDLQINTPEAETLFVEKLNTLFDKNNPADFNQAIMEFGALQCKPGLPDCEGCIFRTNCLAFKKGMVIQYPVAAKKNPEALRFFYYIVPVFQQHNLAYTYLKRRNKKDIWKNLYEFPLIEFEKMHSIDEVLASDEFKEMFPVKKYKVISESDIITHKLTHQIISAQFIQIEIEENYRNISMPEILVSDLTSFPISRLVEKYLIDKNYLIS